MRKPPTLPPRYVLLSDAFLITLDAFEKADGVPKEKRLGAPVPLGGPPGQGPRILAEGLEYVARYRPVPQPRRRQQGQTLRPAYQGESLVPRVPDDEQLRTLMSDFHADATSPPSAERRLCMAHELLLREISKGRVRATAKMEIESDTSTDVFRLGRRKISAHEWGLLGKNYADATASAVGDWSLEEELNSITGTLRLWDVEVCLDDLAPVLSDIRDGKYTKRRTISLYQLENEEWEIASDGRNVTLGTIPGIKYLRGLRAIQLLLRYPDRQISYLILEATAGRPRNTRPLQSDPDTKKFRREVRRTCAELYEQLLLGSITLDEASGKVVNALQEKYPRLKSLEQTEATKQGLRKDPAYDRASQMSRKAIQAALNKIGGTGKVGAEYANYLNEHIEFLSLGAKIRSGRPPQLDYE